MDELLKSDNANERVWVWSAPFTHRNQHYVLRLLPARGKSQFLPLAQQRRERDPQTQELLPAIIKTATLQETVKTMEASTPQERKTIKKVLQEKKTARECLEHQGIPNDIIKFVENRI